MGKIIDRSVRTRRRVLLQYLLNFRPTQCMIHETEVHFPETTELAVLLTRYMDNNYIALLNMPLAAMHPLRINVLLSCEPLLCHCVCIVLYVF